MGVTQKFAEFAIEATYDTLPSDVVEKAKQFIIELAATALPGSTSRLGKRIAEVLRQVQESPGEAMFIGTGDRLSLKSAAFFNSAITDINDSGGGIGVIHHTKNVAPTALTTAACKKRTGKEMITAIVVALECCARLDRLMSIQHNARGQYSDGTIGTIGAAISAAKLFGVKDVETMEGALGNAGMLAPVTVGGPSRNRTDGRPLVIGLASSNGVLSVEMAQAGVKGPTDILECPGGFIQALSGITDFTGAIEDLGQVWLCRDFYLKPFIGGRPTYIPRQGAQFLKEKYHIDAENIDKIIVRLPEQIARIVSHHVPIDGGVLAHSCSAPYLTANVLMYDDVGIDCLSEDRMNEPKVHMLAEKIDITADAQFSEIAKRDLRGRYYGSMEILMKDGKRYSYSSDHVKGDPQKWPMKDEELKDKLKSYASKVLSKDQIDKIITTINELEKVNAAELMDLLARR